MKTRLFVVLLALLAAAGVGWAWLRPAPAPNISFVLLEGGRLELASLQGRPVLVSFWATTCAPCVREAPELARLYRELHPRGFELIAVAMPYDPPLAVRDFARRYDLPYRIAFDLPGEALGKFRVSAIPYNVLVRPDGRIAFTRLGDLDLVALRRDIVKYLPQSTGS